MEGFLWRFHSEGFEIMPKREQYQHYTCLFTLQDLSYEDGLSFFVKPLFQITVLKSVENLLPVSPNRFTRDVDAGFLA